MRPFLLAPAKVLVLVFLVAVSAVVGFGRGARTGAEPEALPTPVPVETPPPRSVSPDQEGEAQAPGSHRVAEGETLYGIARRYGVTVSDLQRANGLTGDRIRAGQVLSLSPESAEPAEYVVRSGESLWEIANRYGVTLEEFVEVNKLVDPGYLQIGQRLVLPSSALLRTETGADEELSGGTVFQWPMAAPVSSPFGPRWGRNHAGIDLAAPQGTPIKAARDGKVALSGEVRGYGNTVILEHADGSRTLYAHCEALKVTRGQQVAQGDVIATVGSTGHSTGPHLHFEIHIANKTRNPLDHLPPR